MPYQEQQQEKRELLERWRDVDWFDYDQDENYALELAAIMENQRLWNETQASHANFDGEKYMKIAYGIYRDFLPRHMISVQTMLGPAALIYYLRFRYSANPGRTFSENDAGDLTETFPDGLPGDDQTSLDQVASSDLPEITLTMESEEIAAKKVRRKTNLSGANGQLELDSLRGVIEDLQTEITREIATDLRNNVATLSEVEWTGEVEDLRVKIIQLSNVVHRKTMRGGCNWLFTSPEIAKVLVESEGHNFVQSNKPIYETMRYCGSRYRVFVDKLFPKSQILMGYKGDSPLDSGYFFCPYIAISELPVSLNPESFTPRRQAFNRYGKKLLREGAKHYAKLTLTGFDEEIKEEKEWVQKELF